MVTVTMSHAEVEKLLEKSVVGRLAVSASEGPYIVPLGYVYGNGKIGFHSSRKGRKVECFKKDQRVCFEVDEANPKITRYRSALVFGRIDEAEDREIKLRILKKLVQKYPTERRRSINFEDCVDEAEVFLITPEKVTGKKRIAE